MLRRAPVQTRTEDGWVLRGESIVPASPRAVAVVGHAMMVDRRVMDRPRGDGLATELARAGAAVLSFDLRGHGASGPSAAEGARYTYDDFVLRDLPAIVAAGRAAFPGLPLALVGHSLAGHAGLAAAGLFPDRAPDRIAALAANMWLPRLEPSVRRRAVKAAILGAFVLASLPRGRFPARALGIGTDDEPLAYVRQFLRVYLRDRLGSVDGRHDYVAALAHVRADVLAVASVGDRLLARPESVRRFVAPVPRARVRVVTRADVEPPPDHMGLVSSPRARPIWQEVARFVVAGAP